MYIICEYVWSLEVHLRKQINSYLLAIVISEYLVVKFTNLQISEISETKVMCLQLIWSSILCKTISLITFKYFENKRI